MNTKRGSKISTAGLILRTCFIVALIVVCRQSGFAQEEQTVPADDAKSITFSRMSAETVQAELLQWLTSTAADQTLLQQLSEKWAAPEALASLSGEQLLDLVLESFAQVDPATKRLVEESYGSGPVDAVIFDGIRSAPFYRYQVQQFRARWLAQHRYYDDALPLLVELSPDDVIDPAGLLFYRAICQSELLQRQDALDSLALLLHHTLDVPSRFRVVAELLQNELADQKDDGMDKVAQLMKDVERRLDLGRPGEETQGQEDAVIAAIDKMLEEMDKQNQPQPDSGSGNENQGNQGGNQGASRSEIKGSAADGEADRKELTETGKWGMLDQQAEAKARELIRQKFPPNFLDQIGRYTKKLAERKK